MRLLTSRFLGSRCKDVRLGASTGGQPPIPGSNTSRPDPTVKENDVTDGVPTIDFEQCPSQIEHFLLIKDTVHQDKP